MNVVTVLKSINDEIRLQDEIAILETSNKRDNMQRKILSSNTMNYDVVMKIKSRLANFDWYNFNEYIYNKHSILSIEKIVNKELDIRVDLILDKVDI